MKIRNARSYRLEVAVTGQVAEPGDVIDVPDDLGAELCKQPANWTAAGDTTPVDDEPDDAEEADE